MSASPCFISPCIPVRAEKPPAGEGWIHEPKLDGYRLQIVKHGKHVRLYSRRGYDWTRRLASPAKALNAIPGRATVIDAELCFPGPSGAPDFFGLKAALAQRPDDLAIFAFDLLHLNGIDLCPLPLIERRWRLARLLGRSNVRCLHCVECFDDGAKLFKAAERHGLEGIVSKRRDAPYVSGEYRGWVKVKTEAWRAANRERWRLFQRTG